MNLVKNTVFAAFAGLAITSAPAFAKDAPTVPSCCVGGNCCASGKCCNMAGCCKADKSCCDPAKGVCTSACGCLTMNCCSPKSSAKKAVTTKSRGNAVSQGKANKKNVAKSSATVAYSRKQ